MNIRTEHIISVVLVAVTLAACNNKSPESASPQPSENLSAETTTTVTSAEPKGAVQRDYPSAMEESALKLNYPLFLAYGGDAARVTPFFPGASQYAVSVKLAASGAGYSLQAEGSTCAFPVVYELKSVSGSTLAGGEYTGTKSVDLPGWSVSEGTAVLSLRMTDNAANNFGCNIVVRRK